jgi:hypothetical protein
MCGLPPSAYDAENGQKVTGMLMRPIRFVLAAWTLGALPFGVDAAEAVSAGDIQALRESQALMARQLEALNARVAQLERANTELIARNSQPTHAAPPATPAARSSWLERFKWNGDFRVRLERMEADGVASRDRERIQSHFGFEAALTDDLALGLQLATGGDDPRSANQTLTGIFARKPLGVDLGFLRWTPAEDLALTAGKMKYPLYKPSGSKLYDGDVNPEGFALAVTRSSLFGSLYALTVDERAAAADTRLVGAQLGTRLPLGDAASLTAALGFSDLGAGAQRRPFFALAANGNTLNADGTLAFDFEVTQASLEYAAKLAGLPFVAFADGARNAAAPDGLDTAYALGFQLGKAAARGAWEFAYLYQRVEKDAWFGQITDSDFGAGFTDAEGSVLRFGYSPLANGTLNATYYLNDLAISDPLSPDSMDEYQRFQLDFQMRF